MLKAVIDPFNDLSSSLYYCLLFASAFFHLPKVVLLNPPVVAFFPYRLDYIHIKQFPYVFVGVAIDYIFLLFP